MAIATPAATVAHPPVYSRKCTLLIGCCFILSGATGLMYEVLWARMLGLVFGATTLAVSTVLAAFMGGLALGSALAGRWSRSLRAPLRAYGMLEIGIALYALVVPSLFRLVDNLYALVWQQFHPGFYVFSLWRFLLSFLMLLVPTALMGATLPVLSAALLRSADFKSTSVTRLYTCNLAGAIIGTICAGFLLLPTFGMRTTIYMAATINILVGVTAIFAERAHHISKESARASFEEPVQANEGPAGRIESKFWLFSAFISGFVTISTQVAWTRILSMIIGSSNYAFTIVLALFLLGLSGGAYLIGRRDFSENLRGTVLRVEVFTAVSLMLSLLVVSVIPGLLVSTGLELNIRSWTGLLALQTGSAALLILVPAILMGTVMPLVLMWASKSHAASSVQNIGRSYAVNTIGAIAGAFFAGFILIPKTSTKFTIVFGAALCLIVAGLAYQPPNQVADPDLRRGLALGVTGLAVILVLFVFASSVRMNLGGLSIGAYDGLIRELAKTREIASAQSSNNGPDVHVLLMYEEGSTSTVTVRKDWDTTSMAINGRTNASDTADMPTQVMLGQLPFLVAPSVANGLVVGFASGVTVGTMLQSPIVSLACVELEPATIKGSRFFEHVNNRPLGDPRLHLIIDDARSYLRVNPTRYDFIVSEPSHPWVPGVANLFTSDFFSLGRERLADDGVFVQWLQIYQLSTDSLKSILATYNQVFPHVLVFRVGGSGKDLLLVGSKKPLNLDLVEERMKDQRLRAELARVGIRSEADVRSWYVCDERQLVPAVAGATVNTDDNMHIETTVPREAFLPLMQTNSAWIESTLRR